MNLIQIARYGLEHATELSLQSDDHGPRHWRDVARIGIIIGRSEELRPDLLDHVFVFAAIHDSQRQSEFRDSQHGSRAAMLIHHLIEDGLLDDTDEIIDLDYALQFHDAGDTMGQEHEGQKFIGTCWDADRLTIGRVGIVPDAKYMSTGQVTRNFDASLRMAELIRLGEDKDWQEIASMYERHRVG